MNIRSGDIIGRWRVEHILTFHEPMLVAAHDVNDRTLQVTLQVVQHTPEAELALAVEARLLRGLAHPSLPALVEVGTSGEVLFTALERFSADSLADRMAEGTRDWKVSCTWLYALARGLQHLHQEGWVHRSLSPECIYVGPQDQIWILGLQNAVLEEHEAEPVSLTAANLAYMAPEILIDPQYHPARADLYAFGCIAYDLLSDENAFPAAVWAAEPQPERLLLEWKTRVTELDPGPDQPDWVRSLVRKCTHPDSNRRLPDTDTVVAWLESAQGSWRITPPNATPAPVPRDQIPMLNPQPNYIDQEELARAFAREAAERTVDYKAQHDFLVIVAGAVGCAAGLCLSVFSVLYLELSLLG